MKAIVAFIKSRGFFLHLGIILLVVSILMFLLVYALDAYTDHGEFVTVPDFTNQSILKLEEVKAETDVDYKIIDSLYNPQEKPGIVLRQDPEPGSKVKHNRTVYLYVTGMVPPQVVMPKLLYLSERQARLILNSYGLRCGKSREEPADCNGCIVKQLVGNSEIQPGMPVKKGTLITLVVGVKGALSPVSSDTTQVPVDQATDE